MPFEEMRVTTKEFGTLPGSSRLLVPVPSVPTGQQQRLHALAAAAFSTMSVAVEASLGFPLLCASGWRSHRWASWDVYVSFVEQKYGSLENGRRFLAFDSPHETGLACDIGCGGLLPVSATIDRQKKTPLYAWLVEHAWSYGWHPYHVEPWHFEHWVPLDAYRDGVLTTASAEDSGPVMTCADPNDVCEETPPPTEPAA